MTKLTNHQHKFLRSLGHALHPVIMIGQHGLSASVIAEMHLTMTKHELLKIKIRSESRAQRQIMIDAIVREMRAHLIQVIGNIIVIYRAFVEAPQILLPRR